MVDDQEDQMDWLHSWTITGRNGSPRLSIKRTKNGKYIVSDTTSGLSNTTVDSAIEAVAEFKRRNQKYRDDMRRLSHAQLPKI